MASSKVAPFRELPVNRPAFIPMSVWQSLSDEHRRELIDSLFPSNVSLAARHRASFDPVFIHFSDTVLVPQLVHDALNVEPLAFSTYGDTCSRFVLPAALRVGQNIPSTPRVFRPLPLPPATARAHCEPLPRPFSVRSGPPNYLPRLRLLCKDGPCRLVFLG